jgi:hypothetical protein
MRLMVTYRAMLSVLSLFPAFGQVVQQQVFSGPPTVSPAPAGKLYPVSGTVVNSATGEPVRRALVHLNGPVQRVAFTGSDGRFEFTGVPEGTVYASAERPGFFDPRSVSNGPVPGMSNGQFQVGAGSNDIKIMLVPESRVTGRIVDGDGEPVENVQVQVLTQQIEQGRKHWVTRGSAQSDENGYYRVEQQPPGPVIISAAGLPRWGSNEAYGMRFYPDGQDQSSAEVMSLSPGQELRADFTLSAARVYAVSGTFSGFPPKGMGVGMWAEGPDGNPLQVGYLIYRMGSSRFTIRAVPAGSWLFHFQTSDVNGRVYEAVEQVNVADADMQGLRVNFQQGGEIRVHVNRPQDASGAAPAGGNAFAQVKLAALSGQSGRQYFSMQTPDPDAGPEAPPRITISGVPSGRYAVTAQVSGGCLDSIFYGNTDVTRTPLVITSGAPPQALEVNLRNDCGSIEIKMQTESQRPSGVLLIVPEESPAETQVVGVSGNMTYQASNLSPGRYRIYALTNIDGLEYAVPDAMRGLPYQEVTVDAGQSATVNIEIAERGRT